MSILSQSDKRKTAASSKSYHQDPRQQRRNNSFTTKSERRSRNKYAPWEYEISNLKTVKELTSALARLESRVAELEAANESLASKITQSTVERSTAEKPEPEEESTLTRFCRMHGIQTFSEDPTEKLRGLLSEFNIEESAVDMVRDVRNKR